VCAAALMPIGAWLIALGGWPIAALLAAGLAGGYAYTGRPFTLKYRGLGELCIFLTFGPAIMAGAAWMQAGRIEPAVWLLSLPVGMWVTAIVASNYLRDLEEDGAAGCRTLAVRFGGRAYRPVFLALLALPALLIIAYAATGIITPWTLLSLAALPLALGPARDALAGIRRPDVDVQAAKFMAASNGLLFVGLVVGT